MMRTPSNASGRATMPYSLAEAAQATGLNRSTILRAIKNGRISGTRDDQGAWTVEPVELHRVFPPAAAEPKAVPQDAQADALVAELRAQLADMRQQRDAWQGIAERLALGAPKPPEPEKKSMSWWRWLRTTG
jgi:excisionase family DNA binding protein